MSRVVIVGWLIYWAVGLVPPAQCAEAVSRPRSVLESVKELAKPVTYTETKTPLGELVQRVANDTGVPLTTSNDVADEPVAVVVKEFSARELLEQIADFLDYRWGRRGQDGKWHYEIYQDLAGKQREEALRQAALAAAQQHLGEEVHRFAETAALPSTQLQGMAEQYRRWRETFFKLPPAQRYAAWAKEGRQIQRLSVANRLSSPVNRTLALLLGHLTPEQWGLLRQGRPLLFSTDPQPGEVRLPEEMGRAFRAAHPSMDDSWRYGDTEFAEKERQKQRSMEAEWAAASGYRAILRLDTERFRNHGQVALHAYAVPLQPKVAPPSAYAQAEGASLQLSAGPADGAARAEDDSPKRRAALEKDPLLGASKRFKRQPKPPVEPGSPANRSSTTLQELLPDLARSCNLNLIADAYAADRTHYFPIPAEEPTPLYVLLDRITQYGYRWDRVGDLVRIRYRAWFFARPCDVPLRVVRHWNELLAGGVNPPLEEYAATAAALDDDRLELLPGLIRRGDGLSIHEIHFARHALRLYASLTPLQQQALWQGQPIPLAAMTPVQRELFLAPWREQQRQREREQPSAEPSAALAPSLGAASRFALTAQNLVCIAERRGTSTHFRWEPAPAQPAPAATAGSSSTAPSPVAASRRSPGPDVRPDNVSRRTLTRVRFQFVYGPDTQVFSQVSVASRRLGPTLGEPNAASKETQP